MFGYHGRYLRVDASSDLNELCALDPATLRHFVGGVGLGTWIVARETPTHVAPLGSENAIIFALSPLVGSPLTTSAKFAVLAISPLTGRLCDALSSSHFALAAKRVGVDAIAITGARSEPSILFIDGQESTEPIVGWEPASELWGLSANDAERRIRSSFGSDWQIAAIGRAGEQLIPFATISHDGRHAGRGGLGAVLGSKRIKAVAVRGNQRTLVADPERTMALARDLSARSFGPATAKYRDLGTVANLLVFNRFDALPTRNFQSGRFVGVERLAEEELGPARRIARNSCASCTIGCEHIYKSSSSSGGVRLEYESLFALGPLCGIDDPDAVLRAAQACDEAGLDTISTGGTLAFVMECVDRGLLEGRLERTGRTLRFGDGQAVLDAIEHLTERRGKLGNLLALGSRAAAEQIGGEAKRFAPHVKGMELPGYHPRKLHAMALGLAVGTRGADHNRSGAYEADFSEIPKDPTSLANAAAALEDRSALIDSLILCKFLRGVFTDIYAESAEMLGAVTGWNFTSGELREVSQRVVNARKCVNLREGWSRIEDTLPQHIFSATEASGLTEVRLESLISAYYQTRGWTQEGLVPNSLRRVLGLSGLPFEPA